MEYEMSSSTDSWLTASTRAATEQERLCACLDATLSCELICGVTADVAAAFDDAAFGRRTRAVVLACGAICRSTSRAIAELRQPDVGAVASELESCRAACVAARTECERRPFDSCCRVCAEQCARCEDECEACLRMVSVIA